MPLTRSVLSLLHRTLSSHQDYRSWLLSRSRSVATLASWERDFWVLCTSGLKHRISKLDELRVAHRIGAEDSIRGITLVDQLTTDASFGTLCLADIRLAHPLLLDEVLSQRKKYEQRCAALRAWHQNAVAKGILFLPNTELEALIPSADPIVITTDPLGQSLYVAATGNGRMAALKASLPASYYVELLCYLPLQ